MSSCFAQDSIFVAHSCTCHSIELFESSKTSHQIIKLGDVRQKMCSTFTCLPSLTSTDLPRYNNLQRIHSTIDTQRSTSSQPRIASIPEGAKVLELALGLKIPSPLTRYLAWKPQGNIGSFSSYMMSREQNPEQAWSLIRNGWTFVRQDLVQE